MDGVKEAVRDKMEKGRELEKPPQELTKTEKVERRDETLDNEDEEMATTGEKRSLLPVAAINPWRYALRTIDPMMLLMDSGAFAH
eukprot:11631503-Heterocapsa_arctica.AAC.1